MPYCNLQFFDCQKRIILWRAMSVLVVWMEAGIGRGGYAERYAKIFPF